MVSRAVKNCQKIMRWLAKEGYMKHVHLKELKKAIVWNIGCDKRTIDRYIEALQLLEYITEIGNGVYQLNYVKVPGALETLVKGGEQKKLM